jgi:hypothetical protein
MDCTCSKYLHTLYTPISSEPYLTPVLETIFLLLCPWRMDQYLKSAHCPKLHELYLQQKFSSAFQVQKASLFTLFTLNLFECNKGGQVPKHLPDVVSSYVTRMCASSQSTRVVIPKFVPLAMRVEQAK